MSWLKSLLQNRSRRLELSTAGKWFVGFTILLGVVAIYSSNNVIYLLESLLLSCLIFSGVISEYTVSRIQVRREVRETFANSPSRDLWVLKNPTIFPLYCIEVGEVKEGNFQSLAFCVFLPGRSEVRVTSSQIFSERGRYDWNGIGVATSFPFGFAKKIRVDIVPGSRIIWPEISNDKGIVPKESRSEFEVVDGELEEIEPWGDIRKIHWPSSGKSNRYFSRPYRPAKSADEIELSLENRNQWEKEISKTAFFFQRGGRTLILRNGSRSQKISGKVRVMDTLALLPKVEEPSA